MLEELRKYKYIKKSNSELETDRLVNNISYKLWNDNGYQTIYYLGIITELKMLAEVLGSHHTINKTDILAIINSFKANKDVPDEIKNLIDMILEEFDYKEN